jgi:hypothetical protein
MDDRHSKIRKDLGTDHPLFAGMWTTYFADQKWRQTIPKGGDNGWYGRVRETAPRPYAGIGRVPKGPRCDPYNGPMSMGLRTAIQA